MTTSRGYRQPKREVSHNGRTYKLRSNKTQVPDLAALGEFEALIWLNKNTFARGYSMPTNPIKGMGGAITVSSS